MRADVLEGRGVRALLHERHARTCASEKDRRGAAGEARADDGCVVIPIVAHVHTAAIARSYRRLISYSVVRSAAGRPARWAAATSSSGSSLVPW